MNANGIDQLLEQAVRDRVVPGVVAVVGDRDGTTYEGAFGAQLDTVADRLSTDSPNAAPDATAVNPERAAARQEIRRAIESTVDALPAPFRTVFVLRAIEQLSTRDTAAALGIPDETVKTRFHRANRLLRDALSEHFASIWDDAFPFAGRRCKRLTSAVMKRLGF